MLVIEPSQLNYYTGVGSSWEPYYVNGLYVNWLYVNGLIFSFHVLWVNFDLKSICR